MVKAKTNKTTQKSKNFVLGTREGQIFASVPYTQEDFKNSILIFSVLLNVALLIVWVLTQLRSDYAYTIALAILQ